MCWPDYVSGRVRVPTNHGSFSEHPWLREYERGLVQLGGSVTLPSQDALGYLLRNMGSSIATEPRLE